MGNLQNLTNAVLAGKHLGEVEAQSLINAPIAELSAGANRIRREFCGDHFDLCTIINGKSGRCSEDCKFCAQSAHYSATITEYPLLASEKILAAAIKNYRDGAKRFSIVTSGERLTVEELDAIIATYTTIREHCPIKLCASHGLLNREQLQRLKAVGVTQYHCNLETSENYFKQICNTHTYQDKLATLRAAQASGLQICSGGIIGMGETFFDRIQMTLTLRELAVVSVPINILNPIPNTPFANLPRLTETEIQRTIAIFRYLLPSAFIRLAGGRNLLNDNGESLFSAGANAAITGDMLTTIGVEIADDLAMLKRLGYTINVFMD